MKLEAEIGQTYLKKYSDPYINKNNPSWPDRLELKNYLYIWFNPQKINIC